jgi:Holliday junction resolvase
MRAKKTDKNHREIVDAFRKLGCSVFDTSAIGRGFPDILVGKALKTVLVEIKSSDKATFTNYQKEFMLDWKGSTVCRVQDIDGVVRLVKILDNLD